ncbi:MAG: DUF2497 domain-containing protein [Rhodospirillales bacterium]|nr:MAG: DUF2497 domain-containing protein [Rhodospirillales bacterium]
MSEEQKAGAGQPEPSMEDILASIRRILSEDSDTRDQPQDTADDDDNAAEPVPVKDASRPGGGIKSTAASGNGQGDDLLSDLDLSEDPAAESAAAAEPGETRRADILELTPAMRVGPVLSPPTAVASTDVLAQLAKAILDRRDIAIGSRDVTLEGMVREMLRPLLKEWLDRNLPYLIERLVKKEIDQMINRAERLED